jgi:hypothetical protein
MSEPGLALLFFLPGIHRLVAFAVTTVPPRLMVGDWKELDLGSLTDPTLNPSSAIF